MIPASLVPEAVLLLSLLLQGLLLLGNARSGIREGIFFLSLAFSACWLVGLFFSGDSGAAMGVLELPPLLDIPRAAGFLGALLLGRMVSGTREIPGARKPEMLLLLSWFAFTCDLLLLSRHLGLTYMILVVNSWAITFLCGFAFRGRLEGEATLKSWLQSSLSLVVAFGGLAAISLLTGGLRFEQIHNLVVSLPEHSGTRLFLIAALFLPYFLNAGLFPFQFLSMDRGQGAPWSVQAIQSVLVDGATTLAFWILAMRIFGLRNGSPDDAMRLAQWSGLAGGLWLLLFSIGQSHAKRLLGAILGAAWSILLASAVMPTVLAASTITYGYSSILLWGSLLCFVWSRLQEWGGGELLESVHGAGRFFRGSGILFLIALSGPLYVPGSPGFVGAMHLIAAVIEQRSLGLVFFFGILLLLFCYSGVRLALDVTFRRPSENVATAAKQEFTRYNMLDGGSLAWVLLAMLALGIFWNHVFALLDAPAKLFLN